MANPTISDRLVPARESWRPQHDASGAAALLRRAALGVVAIACVGAVAAGGYALLRGRSHGVPLIEADSRPLRVKPDKPGGMQVSGEEEQIMDGSEAAHTDVMAPSPEAPAPQMLAAEIQAAHPAPPPAEAQAAPTPAMPAAPPPPAPAADLPAAAKAPAGDVEVQLAALTTHDGAAAEWLRLTKKMPDLLASRHQAIVQARGEGKTFYRLRIGGFADAAAAAAFCSQVREKGAPCVVPPP